MAAGFTLIDANVELATGVSTDDTASLTPALGDIAFMAKKNGTSNAGHSLTGGGMTWTQIDGTGNSGAGLLSYYASAGTPSAGVLTFSQDNNFDNLGWAIIRPVDLTLIGSAGKNTVTSGADLTVSLTTSPAAALLAYAYVADGALWTIDPGSWTELEDDSNGAAAHEVAYKIDDDDEWIADPDTTNIIMANVIEFSGADDIADRGAPRGTRRGTQRGVHRMKLKNGLWRPLFPGRIIPVPAGAF